MTIFQKLLTTLLIMTTIPTSENLIKPDNSCIQYYGRFDFSNPENVAFDWPGVYIKTIFQGTSCKIILKGQACFDIFVDDNFIKTIMSGPQTAKFDIITGLEDKNHQLLLVKRSESSKPLFFQGLIIDSGKTLTPPPEKPVKKIEFIGDSYTAGFANEFNKKEFLPEKTDSIILSSTNTRKSFGALCAAAFDAQYQIHAISGKGLVRNYNGADPGKELPFYYEKALLSSDKAWDFSKWKADVVVIGIGINDFQADPPYADSSLFDTEYEKLLSKLRKYYPGVKIICCATRVWPTDALIPRIKNIVNKQKSKGHNDIWYYQYQTDNNALYGHPDINDHKIIADGLISLISQATGWKQLKKLNDFN